MIIGCNNTPLGPTDIPSALSQPSATPEPSPQSADYDIAETIILIEERVVSSAAAAATCKSKKAGLQQQNALGGALWRYYEQIDWCYSSGKITQKTVTRWPEVVYPFWEFKGHTGLTQSGGVGSTSFRSWTQGSFALCLPQVLCAQFKYPVVDITVRGDGTSSAVVK